MFSQDDIGEFWRFLSVFFPHLGDLSILSIANTPKCFFYGLKSVGSDRRYFTTDVSSYGEKHTGTDQHGNMGINSTKQKQTLVLEDA